MRTPRPFLALGGTAAGLALLSGCAAGNESTPTSAAPSTSARGEAMTPTSVAPGETGVSGDGVTTAVGAPAESTEDDYFHACRAARTWMESHGGDPDALVEPYLKTIQSAGSAGPGTFGIPWAQLSPGQQSAVIVAVQAAVDGLCG
ncbi:MAG: lipoprotein LpqV [Mycolicibacterium sp.]|uniref:lipoprotein LpqV n=1 Tax=Mycolicibacterium sp. TaxID=2320850 RepID=UPI003D1013A1